MLSSSNSMTLLQFFTEAAAKEEVVEEEEAPPAVDMVSFTVQAFYHLFSNRSNCMYSTSTFQFGGDGGGDY